MLICTTCGKSKIINAYSRHRKGHGVTGTWRLRAPIHKKTHLPNLHLFRGKKYCTKCLRTAKKNFKPFEKNQRAALV